ncbi:Uncharacterised protein [Mycobacteroides abscessus subsp. massiliense]|nr:Uncharacterised protein [Mycobacteroides abscessus subsp. massiliense]
MARSIIFLERTDSLVSSCSRKLSSWLSMWASRTVGSTEMFVNADWEMITKSQSDEADWAIKRRRPSGLVAAAPTRILAAGYHCLASIAT